MIYTDFGSNLYLSLGSNTGISEHIIVSAIRKISKRLEINGISSLYKSKAVLFRNQPDFYNCALRLKTEVEPLDGLRYLQSVEADFGRNRLIEIPKGPRRLDIDMIIYGRRSLKSNDLTLPHCDYRNRKFVLLPLLEIEPGLSDPVTSLPVSYYLERLESDKDQGIYLHQSALYNELISELRNDH